MRTVMEIAQLLSCLPTVNFHMENQHQIGLYAVIRVNTGIKILQSNYTILIESCFHRWNKSYWNDLNIFKKVYFLYKCLELERNIKYFGWLYINSLFLYECNFTKKYKSIACRCITNVLSSHYLFVYLVITKCDSSFYNV